MCAASSVSSHWTTGAQVHSAERIRVSLLTAQLFLPVTGGRTFLPVPAGAPFLACAGGSLFLPVPAGALSCLCRRAPFLPTLLLFPAPSRVERLTRASATDFAVACGGGFPAVKLASNDLATPAVSVTLMSVVSGITVPPDFFPPHLPFHRGLSSGTALRTGRRGSHVAPSS